ACLLSLGSQAVHREYLSAVSFSSSLVAVPVLFSAFGFHNVIPSLAHYLKQEKRTLRLSLILGTFLAFVFYTIWQWLVLGTVPLEALEQVRQAGLPVTYALQMASSGANIYVIGQIFAFLALTTSFLGVGFSFVDFLKDGFHSIEKEISRALCSLLTILPPLIFVLWIPALFEKALGVAGGFGESLLNGVLPVLLFTQMRALCYKSCPLSFERRSGLSLLIILSFFVVALELQALLFG
ncbi:MAG: amino acid transporter, partial [Chlamydiae bacterium]|nr:amino acid transporter [Chlamydiota bacterium]